MSPSAAKGREGFSHHETVTIGGQTTDGFDATNELSYVILESTRPLRCSYPEWGSGSTPILPKIPARGGRDHQGRQGLAQTDQRRVRGTVVHEQRIVKREALDYAMSGCSNRAATRDPQDGNGGINYGAVMGDDAPRRQDEHLQDEQFGLKTGDPRNFKTYDDVWNTFRLQLENVVKHIMIQNYIAAGLKSSTSRLPWPPRCMICAWRPAGTSTPTPTTSRGAGCFLY